MKYYLREMYDKLIDMYVGNVSTKFIFIFDGILLKKRETQNKHPLYHILSKDYIIKVVANPKFLMVEPDRLEKLEVGKKYTFVCTYSKHNPNYYVLFGVTRGSISIKNILKLFTWRMTLKRPEAVIQNYQGIYKDPPAQL